MSEFIDQMFYAVSYKAVEASYYLVKRNVLRSVNVETDLQKGNPELRTVWQNGAELLSRFSLDPLELTYYVFSYNVHKAIPYPAQICTEKNIRQFFDTLSERHHSIQTGFRGDETTYRNELSKHKSYGSQNTEQDWIRIVLLQSHLQISPIFRFYVGTFYKMSDILEKYRLDAAWQFRVNRSIYRTLLCRNMLSKLEEIIDNESEYCELR